MASFYDDGPQVGVEVVNSPELDEARGQVVVALDDQGGDVVVQVVAVVNVQDPGVPLHDWHSSRHGHCENSGSM